VTQAEVAFNKLPRITLAFWIMKIAATTLGETAGDLFSIRLNLGYAVTSAALLGRGDGGNIPG
jgi:uncharacterized membrane-anchored protein